MADSGQLQKLEALCLCFTPPAPVGDCIAAMTDPASSSPLQTTNGVASSGAAAIPPLVNATSAAGGSPPPVQSDVVNQFEQILDARKIDIANPPPCPVPIFKLGLHQICTEGNLTAISSQAKAGKSAVIGAMIASALSQELNSDTFGFSSPSQRGGVIIHFDCEQSPYDACEGVKKLLHRAGAASQPCRLHSYTLADVSTNIRRRLLKDELSRAAKSFGEIHSVFIDGVADLCVDPNDSAEAFPLIEELHRLAIHFKTAIVLVLHENPGGLGSGKTRGHLGSQLERKAESNLRLAKNDEGVTEIYGERCRHAHIPKGTGTCFEWDVELGMHVSCESATAQRSNVRSQELKELAQKAFGERPCMSYTELKIAIAESKGVQSKSAENWVKKLTDASLIQKDAQGRYTKT